MSPREPSVEPGDLCTLPHCLPSVEPAHWTLLFFRLLLQLTQSQQTSFALERNLRTQQEIEDKMKAFSFKEDTLLFIAEVSISPGVYVKRGVVDLFPGSDTIFKKMIKSHPLKGVCLPPLRAS